MDAHRTDDAPAAPPSRASPSSSSPRPAASAGLRWPATNHNVKKSCLRHCQYRDRNRCHERCRRG